MQTYNSTFSVKRLWIILTVSMVVMFGILLFLGREIYHEAPPIPSVVVSADGEIVYTRAEIERGQNTWSSMGGHAARLDMGSWGVSCA